MGKWDGTDLYGGWDDGLAQPASNADLIPLALGAAVIVGSVAVAVIFTALRLARALRPGAVMVGD